MDSTSPAALSASRATPCPPYLLLAHHRSGSNFLNDLLQAHPCLECLNEPLSMHTSFFREHDLVTWARADFDPETWHPSLPADSEVHRFLGSLRDYLRASRPERVIGFKETCLFGKLDWLHAFLPELRLVFLRRDPRAIVSSVLRCGLLDFWMYRELVPPAFRRRFPGYRGAAASDGPDVAAAELVAMSVAARYDMATESLPRFEHHVLQLETLLNEPAETFPSLMRFIGVEPDPAPLAFLSNRQHASRGDAFSSFRTLHDVEHRWRQHLRPEQLQVIRRVLAHAGWPPLPE